LDPSLVADGQSAAIREAFAVTYDLSEEEKRGVLSAEPEKQYAYLVNKVVDWGEVWSLSDGEHWASYGDEKMFPIWSLRRPLRRRRSRRRRHA
jgi:hypothetical protein